MNVQYKGYSANVNSSDRVGAICGEVSGITDVIAFHAGSIQEVQDVFRQSVDDYLDACVLLGRKPDLPMLV